MMKLTGSPNYKMADITRLLTLVEEHMPLGKDEWERLTMAYNASSSRTWVERDMDSLRRKFKALYSMRKPTRTAEMPPHIEKAKVAKQAIDDKANVVEMEDAADEDHTQKDGREEKWLFVEPDFSFDPYFDDNECNATESGGVAASSQVEGTTRSTVAHAILSVRTPLPEATTSSFDRQVGNDGLEAFAPTPKPSPLPAGQTTRQLRPAGLKKPPRSATPRTDAAETAATAKAAKPPAARGYQPGSRDEQEANHHKAPLSASNRLGGGNLYAFRDSFGSKRMREIEDTEQAETSFAKAKPIRTLKTTTVLKQKLAELGNASSNFGSSSFEMMLLFREENERKAEGHHINEDLRRRYVAAAKEASLVADKAEAEDRRRQDKLEMDERARRDKEDARARTQESLLLNGAIMKKG
jgi:hypothetical protein